MPIRLDEILTSIQINILHNNPIVFYFTISKFADIFQFKMIMFVAEEVSAFSMEIPHQEEEEEVNNFSGNEANAKKETKKTKQNKTEIPTHEIVKGHKISNETSLKRSAIIKTYARNVESKYWLAYI